MTDQKIMEAEATLGLAPVDIDLIVAVRQRDQPEIDRLIKLIQERKE